MFNKYSTKQIDLLDKTGHVIYKNNKIAITRKYNKHGVMNYLKDLGDCIFTFIGGIVMAISSPIEIIYLLFSFIPSIDIIDESIDIKEQEMNDKNNQELEDLINKNKENE